MLPAALLLEAGKNVTPVWPSTTVMKLPLLIGVTPSFLIEARRFASSQAKCVTSAPSSALRLMTMAPVSVSSSVVMFATGGVSPTGVTLIVLVALPL